MKLLSRYNLREKVHHVFKRFTSGFCLLLIYELIEEAIEEAIAYVIAAAVAHTVSFVITVSAAWAIKFAGTKFIIVVIKPIIKELTYKKGADKMEKIKAFFKKMGVNMKNNPITILAVVFEGLLCGAGGKCIDHVIRYFSWVEAPWNYVLAAGLTVVIFVILAGLTCYLGFDNKSFAKLRGIVKIVGGEKAVEALGGMVDVVLAAKAEEEARLAAEKAQREEDDRIYAQILAEEKAAEKARIEAEKAAEQAKIDAEKARVEAERRAKIEAYKAAHAAASTVEKDVLM